MSSRLLICLSLAGSCALPALANGQSLPPLVARNDVVIPRPSYREAMKDFPPPGGRFGGGVLEYMLTGGRPEPIAPQYRGVVAPQIGYVTPVPPYIHPVPKYPAFYRGRRFHPPHAYSRHYRQRVDAAPHSTAQALPTGGLPEYNAVTGGFVGSPGAAQPVAVSRSGPRA